MLFSISAAGMLVNSLLAIYTVAGLFIGVIFWLAGFHNYKNARNSKLNKRINKDSLSILGILLIIFIFLLILFGNISIAKKLSFSSPLTSQSLFGLGRFLLILGLLEGILLFISTKWLFPMLIGPLDFNKKPTWFVLSGSFLSVISGVAAMIIHSN
ncbi:hypothetical protein AYJ08_12620 [Brevibacillus sp. SKDU10]|uniref:hypothetical protein n=1 Tax=Brevibacillus sp. SKDU10 TaxID=1247872 RepID=UPI0007D73F6A|nr:hypothetical protein [Brevibacillus sp. SKDU10]OAJ73637.1 hypothetical protein AYJ08_12620 [Brevibacillus sp. SKDU10]